VIFEVVFNTYNAINHIPHYARWMTALDSIERVFSDYPWVSDTKLSKFTTKSEFSRGILRDVIPAIWSFLNHGIEPEEKERVFALLRFCFHDLSNNESVELVRKKRYSKSIVSCDTAVDFVYVAIHTLVKSTMNDSRFLLEHNLHDIERLHKEGRKYTWALSGAHNSCEDIVAFLEACYMHRGDEYINSLDGPRIKANHFVMESARKVMLDMCKRHGV
jgi:hypothetical protein